MSRLEVRLLGRFSLTYKNKPINISSRPAQSLFAYLILNAGTAYRREKLAGLLWPDFSEETARDNLRHALWRVRKALEGASAIRFLQANDLTISFNLTADCWLDVVELRKLNENASTDQLVAALSEYQGELLPGFYEEWVLLEREHLYSIFEHHIARLISLLQAEKRWLDVLDWGERWIKLGQKPELAYRALMTAYAANGEMSKVAATYERCAKSLREWGIEPSEQTEALFNELKSGTPARAPSATSSLPSGIVTFLLTDIEGSTRLWEQHPKAMQAILARHDSLLRNIIERHGGRVIKMTGDGLHAVFAHAEESVTATLACQQALTKESWDELPNPLRVRMALHTGESEIRDGDYFGTTVNRTARLMSIASGGQILVSSATAELVRDQLPPGAALQDLGEHRLRDIARPQRVYQLIGPDLPTGFLPLRSLNTIPNNLTFPLTSFIGREHEMAEVAKLLGTTRLLTLIGPGGTGKTRLSLEVAAELLDTFPDGAWFVEFAPLSDPALVPQAVASIWHLPEQPERPLIQTLIAYLRTKTLLLILDNCEHLIDACAQLVTALLSACPKLKILSSSREALGVAGEIAYPVLSLSLPNASSHSTSETLLQSESARLFVERARAVEPHFVLTTQNVHAVAQICWRLDGIPLALELAAARVRLLSIDQILTRLDDRFRLLKDSNRQVLPRHRTLRALIDWSYDLLNQPERSALAYLSVFAGGWTLAAAEVVLGPDGLDLLSNLVDKSLVLIEETSNGEKRYNLLETIRQYAREKLMESGELSLASELQVEYYHRLAQECEPKLEGSQMVQALNQLEPELDNLRTALEWTLERNPETTLQIIASLTYFWRGRGHITEGRRWLSDAFSKLDVLPPRDNSREQLTLKAKALWSGGTLAFGQGELIAAHSALAESARLARAVGAQKTLVHALNMLAYAATWIGDGATADAAIEEGLKLARDMNYKLGIGVMLSVQANYAAEIQRDFTSAREFAQQSAPILREVGNPFFIATHVLGIAYITLAQGNYMEARVHLEESERLFRELDDKHMALGVQSERAHIERRLGHYPEATAIYHENILAWQELGHRASLAHEFECLAFIALAQSQFQRAARLLGAAEILRESLNSPMTALERIEYDQNVAALRSQLDEFDLAKAWTSGRSMTLEQVVEFAME